MRELFIEELERVEGGKRPGGGGPPCKCCLATTLACCEEGECSGCCDII